MKLVDILARDLKAWPFGRDTLGQAKDGSLHTEPFDGDRTMEQYTRGEDFAGAIVTRSQWQAAVDALKAGEQVEWSGVGLPPVGAICEVMDDDQVWHLATVKMHGVNFGKDVAIAQAKDAILWCMESHHVRPARTAEQIAEQAHREAVEELAAATNWMLTREACELVLAAGYRKQEVKS